MEHLSHADLVRALEVASQLGRVTDVDNVHAHIIESVRPLFGEIRSSSEIYQFVDGSIRREEGVICAVLTPQLDDIFHAMVVDHPYASAMATLRGPRVLEAPSEITEGRRFADYAIYHEFYRQIDVKDQIVFGAAAEWPRMYVFSIGRDLPFSDRESTLVRLLQQHIFGAWHNWWVLREARRTLESREAALNAVNLAMIDVDGHGRVLRCSPGALALLERRFGTVRRDAVSLPRVLQRWVVAQARQWTDPDHSLAATGQAQLAEAQVHARLLRSRQDGPFTLVLRDIPSDPGPEVLRRLGLTETQALVLHWVARGMSNKQVAEQLGVSHRTISTHLEAIYRALRVENRTAASAVALRTSREAAEDGVS